MFEMHGDTYEMSVVFDEDTDEYVVTYEIGGEIENVGRGSSVPRAVGEMYRQMGSDIGEALQND